MTHEGPAGRSGARRAAAESFYGDLEAHEDPSRRVGWESGAGHALRLAAIVEALVPVEALGSVIDVGCGEAALLPVLSRAGFAGRYRGEDVRPSVVARAQVPAHVGEVIACDSFALGLPAAAAVVCSGTLNTVSGEGVDHDDEVTDALTALWERTEEVLAVDLAVVDRHAPGVGLARADLGKVWAHARTLSPIVVVREDVIVGEALIVLSRSRARAYGARLPDTIIRAEALLQAGEAEAALAATSGQTGARVHFVVGQALAALGRQRGALAALERAAAEAEAAGDVRLNRAARLAMAPSLWRSGDKRAAEALLVELSRDYDEARPHLVELLVARKEHARALEIVRDIEDPWIRRELEARLSARR